MKKIIILILFILYFICFEANIFADELSIVSPNYAVYRADDLELLIGNNEDEKISIASITKLMTAVVCVDNIEDLNEKITVNYWQISNILDPELSIAGIYDGQQLSYYDLLATMLVPSGADSALYIATYTFDSYDTFIAKMNEKAQEIGMTSTHFSNPTGLDDENNYSTINDVAKLLKYTIDKPVLKELISLDSYTTTDGLVSVESTISRLSRMKNINIEYIEGGKTGTTGDAGICLASYSTDENMTLLTVVTGASMYSSLPYNLIDTETLDRYISENYSMTDIITPNDEILKLPTYCCMQDCVTFYLDSSLKEYITQFDKNKVKIEYDGIDEISFKNNVGDYLGQVKIYYDGKLLDTVDITLNQELEFSIVKWIKLYKIEIAILAIAVICFIVIIRSIIVKKKKKRVINKRKSRS